MKNTKLENRRQSDSYKELMFIQHYDREQMVEFDMYCSRHTEYMWHS